MLKTIDKTSGQKSYILYPGEAHATGENCFLVSVTGTCLLVCLHETRMNIGGMCFMIVPGSFDGHSIIKDSAAYLGVTQIEMLMAEIVKLGGNRKNLKAKVFGGADNIFEHTENNLGEIQQKFINDYFELENIPIVSKSVGGGNRRKVYFSPSDGKAFVKSLENNSDSSEYLLMEQEFINNVIRNSDKTGDVMLF